jgi:hypothetical protein
LVMGFSIFLINIEILLACLDLKEENVVEILKLSS